MERVVKAREYLNVCWSGHSQAREGGVEEQERRKQAFVDELKSLPIAVQTSIANEQHYEASGRGVHCSLCMHPLD